MRNLQSNISLFGNMIVRQGIQLINCGEGLRSLCASSLRALDANASRLFAGYGDAFWLWLRPCLSWVKPRVGMVSCVVTVTQHQRRHATCHRTVA